MQLESLKQSQGAERKAHFANGGTPKTWRGDASTLDEAKSKARQNKRACRQVHNEEN